MDTDSSGERSRRRGEILAALYGVRNLESACSPSTTRLEVAAKRPRNTFSSAVTSASVECELPAGYTSEQLLLGPYKQEVLEHANAANRSASANWDFIEQDPALWRVDIEEAEETTKNPRNDYSANYVETGEFPQNKVRDAGYARRFEEYPKLRELIRLKDELVAQTSTYAYWAPLDLARRFVAPGDGHSLFGGFKFDVIVVEPPLAEYEMTNRVRFDRTWTWDAIRELKLDEICEDRSFVWLWCGDGDGLEGARDCLTSWGFRRSEDICWVKTNKRITHDAVMQPRAVFKRTKEHCLMGIKGLVNRNADSHLIHSNVDLDIILAEQNSLGNGMKPAEIMSIAEHFCLGKRRLYLFGSEASRRNGWFCISDEPMPTADSERLAADSAPSSSSFRHRAVVSAQTVRENVARERECLPFTRDEQLAAVDRVVQQFRSHFSDPKDYLVRSTDEIERLRPKSPTPRSMNPAAAARKPSEREPIATGATAAQAAEPSAATQ